MRKAGVLVIHNRYRQAGGEDTVVRAEVALLRQRGHRVTEYVRDNTAIDRFGALRKASLMLSATWNQQVYTELREIDSGGASRCGALPQFSAPDQPGSLLRVSG